MSWWSVNKQPIKDPLKTIEIKPTLGKKLTKAYLKNLRMNKFKKGKN